MPKQHLLGWQTHVLPFSSWACLCPGHCWPSLDVQGVGKGGSGVLVAPRHRHGSGNARSDNHFVRLSSNQRPRSLRVWVQEEFPGGAEAQKGYQPADLQVPDGHRRRGTVPVIRRWASQLPSGDPASPTLQRKAGLVPSGGTVRGVQFSSCHQRDSSRIHSSRGRSP